MEEKNNYQLNFEVCDSKNSEHVSFLDKISSDAENEDSEFMYLHHIKRQLTYASFTHGKLCDTFGFLIKYNENYVGCVSGELSLMGNSIIMEFYIDQAYRRRGYGKDILTKYGDILFKTNNQVKKIILFLEQGNDIGSVFLEKMGLTLEPAKEYKQYVLNSPYYINPDPVKALGSK